MPNPLAFSTFLLLLRMKDFPFPHAGFLFLTVKLNGREFAQYQHPEKGFGKMTRRVLPRY